MKTRKAQEEMVGFVMVVVVVAVIFLVFLGIMMRKPGAAEDRTRINEVSLFLDAMLEYTTDCEIAGSKLSFKDAIIEARETNRCLTISGNLDDELSKLSREIIEKSWNMGSDKPYKGYIFQVVFEKEGDTYREDPEAEIINEQNTFGLSVEEREAKTAEKPIGKGIIVILKVYENLGAESAAETTA